MRRVRDLVDQLSKHDQDREVRVEGQEPVVLGDDTPYVNLVAGPVGGTDPEDVAP